MNNKILNYLRNKVSHNKKWLKAMEDYFLYKSINEKASKEADLIMLGMATPDDHFMDYYESMLNLTKDMPTSVFVLAGQEISFGEVLIPQETMSD